MEELWGACVAQFASLPKLPLTLYTFDKQTQTQQTNSFFHIIDINKLISSCIQYFRGIKYIRDLLYVCTIYTIHIKFISNVWLFAFFNIWYSIFMFNFEFWFPFLKLSGVGTSRDMSDQKSQRGSCKDQRRRHKGFRDPFVQFFHHHELVFSVFSSNICYCTNIIVRPPNGVPTACSTSHPLRLRDLHVPGEENHKCHSFHLPHNQIISAKVPGKQMNKHCQRHNGPRVLTL